MNVTDRRRLPVLALAVGLLFAGCLGGSSPPAAAPDSVDVTWEPGPVEGATYVPENDTVRIVVTRTHTGPERVEWVPFEEFAFWECQEGAKDEVDARLREEFGEVGGAVSTGIGNDRVGVRYVPEEGGSREAVARVVPERVNVSLRLFGERHTCTVPVTVEEGEPVEPLALAG